MRETLVNALGVDKSINLSKEALTEILTRCGLDTKIRGEALDIYAFAELNKYMNEAKI